VTVGEAESFKKVRNEKNQSGPTRKIDSRGVRQVEWIWDNTAPGGFTTFDENAPICARRSNDFRGKRELTTRRIDLLGKAKL